MRSPWTLHKIAPALLVERNDLTVVLRGAPFGQLVENVRSAQTRWTWTVPWVAHTSGLRRCQPLRPLFPALVARTTRREQPVSLGITPTTVHREQRPRETFHVYDNSLASVELVRPAADTHDRPRGCGGGDLAHVATLGAPRRRRGKHSSTASGQGLGAPRAQRR